MASILTIYTANLTKSPTNKLSITSTSFLSRSKGEKKSGKYKGNEVYSKYFIPAVLQNWVENETNKKNVQKKAALKKRKEASKKREKDITERLIEETGGDDGLLDNIKKTSPELARTIERITKNLFAKASKPAQ